LSKHKVLLFVNSTWNIYNFRLGLVNFLRSSNYKVVAVAPADNYLTKITSNVCAYYNIKLDKKGLNIFNEMITFYHFLNILKKEKPDVLLTITIKPNIYGSIAAYLLDIPVINNIAGLGTTFSRNGILKTFILFLFRLALSSSNKVFFQNSEDKMFFINKNLVDSKVTDLLPGSGVNLKTFSYKKPSKKNKIRFLLISRMIYEKGVEVFVNACRVLIEQGHNCEFCLLGFIDSSYKGAISEKKINHWVMEGIVNYLGETSDVRNEIQTADCVVLPSFYHEGTPRVLLEASAIGRPLITTDTNGCRNVVNDNNNGFICKPNDHIDLADKMRKFTKLSSQDREKMGLVSRKIVSENYDEKIVISIYSNAISRIIDNKSI
jgi:glycosyltransferase involved in cell wall biosynthesis